MKKQIFVGPPNSDKSRAAELINQFTGEYVLKIDARTHIGHKYVVKTDYETFFNTQCIIIDNCPPEFDYIKCCTTFSSPKYGIMHALSVFVPEAPVENIVVPTLIFITEKLPTEFLNNDAVQHFQIVQFPLNLTEITTEEAKAKELKNKLSFYQKLNNKLDLILNNKIDIEDYSQEVYDKIEQLEEEVLNLQMKID